MANTIAAPSFLLTHVPRPAVTVTPTPSPALAHTPASDRSNNTFLMSASPVRSRRSAVDGYKPKMISTIGAKPACLVNASVTYVGDDQIYAFGGFDQYTDEGRPDRTCSKISLTLLVYNHVLRLNLTTRQWNLVDNYGDIPGVRMGECICSM